MVPLTSPWLVLSEQKPLSEAPVQIYSILVHIARMSHEPTTTVATGISSMSGTQIHSDTYRCCLQHIVSGRCKRMASGFGCLPALAKKLASMLIKETAGWHSATWRRAKLFWTFAATLAALP